eukprot:Skav227828  [mRNA]  locus=scaffold948:356415:357431:+ [translate_table: standard]
MASIIAGTWSLISSSAEVVSKARGMTLGIHKLLQPEAVDLSDADRRRLIGLQRRVQCMIQPLNFLLLWSKTRDDRVQQVVLSAQELLFDIYTFIEDLSEDQPRSRRWSNATKSEQLDFFLRELDFTCISVNMALNMERRNDPAETEDFSLLALLRAHRRIKEMEGRSGHLCAMLGCLYKGTGRVDETTVECSKWSPAMSLATFKVVAMLPSSGSPASCVQRYGIEIESRLPLSRGSSQAQSYGLNSSARLEFPISAACEAQLQTTGRLNLAVAGQDLAVDSLALAWTDCQKAPGETKGSRGSCYAFVFDGPGDTGELVLTPLDAIYLARLCAKAAAVA